MDQLTEEKPQMYWDYQKKKWIDRNAPKKRDKAANREGSFFTLKSGKIRYRKVINGVVYEVVAKDKPSCREKMQKKELERFNANWKKENLTLEDWVTEWHAKYIKDKDNIAESTKAEYWKVGLSAWIW